MWAPYLLSVVIRAGVAGGFTAAAMSAGQINTAIGAIAIGIASPLVLQQMARQVATNPHRLPDAVGIANAGEMTASRSDGGEND